MDKMLNTLMAKMTSASTEPDVESGHQDQQSENDLRTLLAKKESDLTLAAELGKALLERNEELKATNEMQEKEFTERIEQLEQDRHRLRLQLEVMEDEYEQRVAELKGDLVKLRSKLEEVSGQNVEEERSRALIIENLTEQNLRLTEQLSDANRRETDLTTQLEELRARFDDKRHTIRDHVNYLETLKEEIRAVTARKEALERRIGQILDERHDLSSNLDLSADKIAMLEKQNREQEYKIQLGERELCELREANQSLSCRLETASRSMTSSSTTASSSGSGQQVSLFNELEMSNDWKEQSGHRSRRYSRISEVDEEIQSASSSDPDFDQDSQMTFVDSEEMKELREEVRLALRQIRLLCDHFHSNPSHTENEATTDVGSSVQSMSRMSSKDLKKRRRRSSDSIMTTSSSSSYDSGRSSNMESKTEDEEYEEVVDKGAGVVGHKRRRRQRRGVECDKEAVVSVEGKYVAGLLTEAVNELRSILRSRQNCSCKGNYQIEDANAKQKRMSVELEKAQMDIKQKDGEIHGLQTKLSMLEIELKSVEEERDLCRRDLETSEVGKDELVRKAWDARDAAMKRKNNAEMELAKERIGFLQVNSQLMEAIQQKVELSQQLDAWQSDMEVLLEEQIRDRLLDSEKRSKARKDGEGDAQGMTNNNNNSASGGFFSFFSRR